MILSKEKNQWLDRLSQELNEFMVKLKELAARQQTEKNIEKIAASILQYNQLEKEISDRGYIISALNQPLERLTSDFFKTEIFSYFEAAETVGPELVDFLVEAFHQLSKTKILPELETIDLYQAHYKEYVFPGKILAQKFEQLDALAREMNEYIVRRDPQYDHKKSQGLLAYSFQKAINADIRLDPLIEALRQREYEYLKAEERNKLLEAIEERLGVLRFEAARQQELAMAQAIGRLEN